MKTKYLNFIEAYEAVLHKEPVFMEDGEFVTTKGPLDLWWFNGSHDIKFITRQRFYIKEKPLKLVFETNVCGNEEVYSKSFGNSGTWGIISGDVLNPFIGKRCKVTIEEILE